MFFGVTLLIIGAVFLLQNIGLISVGVWSIVWPALLIILGISFLVKKHGHSCLYCGGRWRNKDSE